MGLSLAANQTSSSANLQFLYFSLVVTVPRSVKGLNGKCVYDKLQYCLFCGKGQQSIARHLQEQHSGRDEVKALQSLKAKDRSLNLDELCGKRGISS